MRRIVALLLMLAAPLVAQAQHPDFSGKWTYDASASSQSMMGSISSTMNITQTPSTLKNEQTVTSSMGTQSSTFTYKLDGSPSTNTVDAQGQSLTLNSTATWEGSTLVITTTADFQGQAIKTVDRWSLDASGKVMTQNTDVSVGPQSMSQKKIFNKS
jgi:hypothetical protein